jgi:hypothetical protein
MQKVTSLPSAAPTAAEVEYLKLPVTKGWLATRALAMSLPIKANMVLAVYRRGIKSTPGGDKLFLWRQDLGGDGDRIGRLGGTNDGYEFFYVAEDLLASEYSSDDLRNKVLSAINGPGGGGPASDVGPR